LRVGLIRRGNLNRVKNIIKGDIGTRTMKTIIFDFGNVIGFVDHRRGLEKLRPFTTLTPEAMLASAYDGELEDRFERGSMTPLAFLEQAHQLWQLRCDIEFLAEAFGDIFCPNPEVCDLVPKLARHHRILLGSNTNAIHSQRFTMQFADVLSHFDSLVLSHEIGARKPAAEFFRHCHDLADAQTSECVFVDDLVANIEGARAFGFHGIVYRPHANLAESLRSLGAMI
jgi:FMN phosphatase YigB (HAD superfamily)